ncbi:MAG: uncharacterized protein KVP18_003729 [Porospora cf. gigantea A]|uniref:uncharacterized protein n=1 Tax=Porospora cf. gigantea A TaxID=2853593 RepID=UPI00355AB3AE|nr:MAG: hypothetical protein KVP18_003729 [Porospora cf. gigantea A]
MHDVILRVYDVSQGVARRWSRLVLGQFLEAVYHTGVLYRGREYYYCGSIQRSRPEEVAKIYALDFLRSVRLGQSEMAVRDFENMLHSKRHLYTPETYDIAKWNCNHFSDRAVRYLTGRGIPLKYTHQTEQISRNPTGKLAVWFVKKMNGQGDPLNDIQAGIATLDQYYKDDPTGGKLKRLSARPPGWHTTGARDSKRLEKREDVRHRREHTGHERPQKIRKTREPTDAPKQERRVKRPKRERQECQALYRHPTYPSKECRHRPPAPPLWMGHSNFPQVSFTEREISPARPKIWMRHSDFPVNSPRKLDKSRSPYGQIFGTSN